MQVTIDIDLEKFRYTLIGDGYTKEEVLKMSREKLVETLRHRIDYHIEREYYRGERYGLYD